MKPIKVALLGAGRMGKIHWHNLQSFSGVSVSRVYDPELVRKRESVDGSLGEILTDDIHDVVSDSSIAACIIATPSTFHAELITLCSSHGKHIFCEKPVSFDVSCLQNIKSIVENAGVILQIGFNRRFDPSTRAIRDRIQAGNIGDIQVIKITNRDPQRPRLEFVKNSGGLFFDFNVHDFDTLKFITNDEVHEVYAAGDALIQPELRAFNDIDTAVISVKMKRGAFAIIDSSRETGYGYDQQLEVLGSAGMVHMKNQHATSVIAQRAMGSVGDRMHETFVERYRDSYQIQLREFFSTIAMGQRPSPNIDDAIHAVKAAYAAQKSYAENRSVALGA